MSITRKIQRQHSIEQLKIEKKEATSHPCSKYIDDLKSEIETMLHDHPEVQAYYKNQILLLRNEYEKKATVRTARLKETVTLIIKKSEEAVLHIEADYRYQEVWELMKSMELERDEIKSIIENYAEKE